MYQRGTSTAPSNPTGLDPGICALNLGLGKWRKLPVLPEAPSVPGHVRGALRVVRMCCKQGWYPPCPVRDPELQRLGWGAAAPKGQEQLGCTVPQLALPPGCQRLNTPLLTYLSAWVSPHDRTFLVKSLRSLLKCHGHGHGTWDYAIASSTIGDGPRDVLGYA